MSFRRLFADEPMKEISKLPSFRAEHFPYSGPYPWLDHDDALEQIESKRKAGAINEEEAEQCRHWTSDGYVILNRLISDEILDDVWICVRSGDPPR